MRGRGLSLIELLVVVVAVGVMAGFALERLLPLIGRAERAAFLTVQRQLNSALLLEAAERITRGESETLIELAGANPMALLLDPPANYVGSVPQPDHAGMPNRSWYFDEARARLVYRPGPRARVRPAEGPEDRIEFRVQFVYDDRDADGRFIAGRDRFAGLRLKPLHAFSWPE